MLQQFSLDVQWFIDFNHLNQTRQKYEVEILTTHQFHLYYFGNLYFYSIVTQIKLFIIHCLLPAPLLFWDYLLNTNYYINKSCPLNWICSYCKRLPFVTLCRICLQCRRFSFSPWAGEILQRRKWQPNPVFLPKKSHEQRRLVGWGPQDHKESDTT